MSQGRLVKKSARGNRSRSRERNGDRSELLTENRPSESYSVKTDASVVRSRFVELALGETGVVAFDSGIPGATLKLSSAVLKRQPLRFSVDHTQGIR